MVSPDDTQPRLPRVPAEDAAYTPPGFINPLEDDQPAGGPGCLVWGLLSLMVIGCAGLTILLSGVAGWTSGQRIAQLNAAATQDAVVAEQLNRIPQDVASGNQTLLAARLRYLATLTPGVSGLVELAQTATAVHLNALPTATPPPTETEAAILTPASLEPPTTVAPPPSGLTLDLDRLLDDAQAAVDVRDWSAAIELLDVIAAADPGYQTLTVRDLLGQALRSRALALFRSGSLGDLAEAIVLTDRAAQFGDVGELAYESYIGSLYLDALNSIGVSYPTAIAALQTVYRQVPGYRDVAQLLFSQYMGYGDAWAAQGDFCAAAAQYQGALGVFASAEAAAKRDNAQTACAQATLNPGITLPDGTFQPIAPIGVPGT